MNYEVYIGLTEQNRKKTYLVFDKALDLAQARKFFRCSLANLVYRTGYVLNDELYFNRPHKKGEKKVMVAYYVSRRSSNG